MFAPAFPVLMTAADLVRDGVVPGTQDQLLTLAKRHGVGRKWGRTYVFRPEDVAALIEALPCPSESSLVGTARLISTSGERSAGDALTKALALATPRRRKKSA